MTTPRRIFTIVLLLLIFSPTGAYACTCASGFFGFRQGCDRSWSSGQVIFVGKVTAKLDLAPPSDQGFRDLSAGYAVHFSVTDNFREGNEPGSEMVVYTGSGGGDCGYPFVVGASYLVYASGRSDHLYTSICTKTRPEGMAGGIVRELRAIRDKGHGDELFGTVATWPPGWGSDAAKSKPLGSVAVQATGSNGRLFSAQTDEQGAFAFAALPPDTYNIVYDIPEGLRVPQLKNGNTFLVQLASPDASGAGCELSAFPLADGQISGVVVDSRGHLVSGSVTVEPADPTDAREAWRHGGIRGCDTEAGKFLVELLPPGRYKLFFVPKALQSDNSYEKVYWPPNSDAIELAFGQHIDNVRFEVPVTVSEPLPGPD
jgi:hypothetical protein